MIPRILSTLGLWTLIALALILGKIWGGLALLILLTAAAHWEFCTILQKCGANLRREFSVMLGVFMLGFIAWRALHPDPLQNDTGAIQIFLVLPGILIGAVSFFLLWKTEKLVAFFKMAPTSLTWLYLPCSMAPLAFLAADFWKNGSATGDISGMLLVVWLIATVKFTDCGALVVGCSIGKHKLAPGISPGKTWEGALGGILTSVAVGAGIAALYQHNAEALGWSVPFPPAKAALLAVPLAILSIPSDLIESVFKRAAGVKDSGKTIPGIGGAFDLLDSLVLTAPAGYLLFKIFLP